MNKTDDIEGGQADTLKRCPKGNRHINPLEPNYFYPGEAENVNNQNDPYGMRTSSMGFNNFRTATAQGVKALKEETAKSIAVGSETASQKLKFNRPQTAMPM